MYVWYDGFTIFVSNCYQYLLARVEAKRGISIRSTRKLDALQPVNRYTKTILYFPTRNKTTDAKAMVMIEVGFVVVFTFQFPALRSPESDTT